MKQVAAIIAIIMGGFLVLTIGDLPAWGDAYAPANNHVSRYYLEHAKYDTKVPNVVTAVLADYRAFDTMMETAVVFVAMMAIMSLIRNVRKSEDPNKKDTPPSIITKVSARIMVPFMQLFALYVVAHGHYSPGGGFQGGVILGASVILLAMSFDLPESLKKFNEKTAILFGAVGVLIFAGWGLICLLLGSNFLDYSVTAPLLLSSEVMARSHSMLIVEIGVAMTVMAGMYIIYANMVSDGRLNRGL